MIPDQKSIFENVAKHIDQLVALTEHIPNKNLESAMSVNQIGYTLVIVRKRELDEIREKLRELVNLLSK
jgi:hypothetical protein